MVVVKSKKAVEEIAYVFSISFAAKEHACSLPQLVTRRGFEPLFPDPYSGILPLNDRAIVVAQTGIEPIAPAYETGVLPLQPPRIFVKGQSAKGKKQRCFH